MGKTFTVSQNIAQEAISVHEKKTSFADIRNSIVAEEAIDVHEQKTSFPDIGNLIVAQEAVDECEQKTSFPHNQSGQSSSIGMDSREFTDPRDQCHTIGRGKEISYIHSENPSAENKTGIMPSCKGATA